MTTRIIICPTLRRAFYEWHRLADTYPDMWVDSCRKPMSLTSVLGVKYVFCSEAETDIKKGLRGDLIIIDEFDMPKAESAEKS